MASPDAFSESSESPLLTVPEASRVLRIRAPTRLPTRSRVPCFWRDQRTPRRSFRTKEPARAEMGVELRCRLGPASWTVLEAMMQRASETDAGLVVAVSIRSLASSLGLSKDTLARSVRRLRDAGLVSSLQRRGTSGVFAAGCYRLAVPAVVSVPRQLVRSSRRRSRSVSRPSCPPLVRPARARSRGLRSLPVSVCLFARSSVFRQVPADWWEWS